MGVSSRTLEITVISGENVLNVTEEAYVVVRSESLNCCTTRMVKDSNGNNNVNSGSFLSWNEKFLLDMPVHARSITFEVQCNKFKGARPVGVTRIALSDLLGAAVVQEENCLRILSYRLRDFEGRRNGVIHFAVRVATPEEYYSAEPVKGAVAFARDSGVGHRNSNGVVTGVPFWWNYPNII